MIRKYYTLEDLVKEAFDSWPDGLDLGDPMQADLTTTLFRALVEAFYTTPISSNSPIVKDQSNVLFCSYIAPIYKDFAIGYTDNNSEDFDFKEFIRKYVYILNTSFDKYTYMIQLLEDNKADLMSDLKSISQLRFNDTPQNEETEEDDFSDTNHTTNITTTESTTSAGTIISKINQIDNMLKDYYEVWAKKFKDLFIYV